MKILHPQASRFSARTAVVIMARNRYFLTRLFLSSLQQSRLDDALIILVDDASKARTAALLHNFHIANVAIVKIVISESEHQHLKIYDILRIAWDLAIDYYACHDVAVLDADTVVQPDWLLRMRTLYKQQQQRKPLLLVSGYNSKAHRTLLREDGFCHKASLGGLSLLFSAWLYHHVVRDILMEEWDWRLTDSMQMSAGTMLALSPSVIQHTGCFSGSHNSIFKTVDCSFDYPAWWTWTLMLPYYLPHLPSQCKRLLRRMLLSDKLGTL